MKFLSFLFPFILLLTIVSCNDDDTVIENEEELITTLQYILVDDETNEELSFLFVDLDGDGGMLPSASSPALTAFRSYTGRIVLLNESETPAEDITEEIMEEDDEHQFFFIPDGIDVDIAIDYDDMDADGLPVGLNTKVQTGNSSIGKLRIILRHQPDKGASGVSEGDITNAGGETDIEVEFDLVIQ